MNTLFPVEKNADRLVVLLQKHLLQEATKFLTELGFCNAAQQVKDLYGFILQYGKVKKE